MELKIEIEWYFVLEVAYKANWLVVVEALQHCK